MYTARWRYFIVTQCIHINARGVRGSAISGLSESVDMSGFEKVIVFLA